MPSLIMRFRLWLIALLQPVTSTPDAPPLVDPTLTPAMQEFIERLQGIINTAFDGKAVDSTPLRTILSTVFPHILKLKTNDKLDVLGSASIEKQRAKEWATASAFLVGLLAGLVVEPKFTDRAIDEMTKKAKTIGKLVATERAARGMTSTSTTPPTTTTDPEARAVVKREAEQVARARFIKELEDQADAEANPEAQQALRRLADVARKELDLDKAA